MIHYRRPPVTRGLFVGLDVLLSGLVVLSVALAPDGSVLASAIVSAILLAVYSWGRVVVRVHERPIDAPRGAWWPDTTWILALLVPWGVLLWLTPGALWIAFPLMFLQMHVLGPHRGPLAVGLTTALAVIQGLTSRAGSDDGWIGYVLGPILGAAVAIGVVLGLEALVRESQARQRTVDELTQVRLHLAQADREHAVATERERFARDIHDTLAQSLSAIELLLRTADTAIGADDTHARALIAQARAATHTSLADARQLVEDLTPADLNRTTLLGALERVAARAVETSHDTAPPDTDHPEPLTVTVHTAGDPRPLPINVETALLRIAQSALANVTQHASATLARITLTIEPESVSLDIVDNGTGFDPSTLPPRGSGRAGFGIPAIRARADELGGHLTIESTAGHGTALAVVLPVPATEVRP